MKIFNIARKYGLVFLLLAPSISLGAEYLKVVSPTYDTAPRPQLMPEALIELDNLEWDFAVGDDHNHQFHAVTQKLFPYKINFGFAPESYLSGLNYEALRPDSNKDVVWYRKSFKLPENWEGALLTFEGIDYESEVYVNEKFVVRHKGGFAPFEADISSFLKTWRE